MNNSVNGTQVSWVLIVKRQHHSHGHCTAKDNPFVTSSDLPDRYLLSSNVARFAVIVECC